MPRVPLHERQPFTVIQLWDSTLLPRELMEHVQDGRSNGSIEFWSVRGQHGPHGDHGYGPANYSARTLRLDELIDAWVIERGGTAGSRIAWHIWW